MTDTTDFVLVPRKLDPAMAAAGWTKVTVGLTNGQQKAMEELWIALVDAAPKSEPVPATNQAGEVEGAIRIAVWNACRDRGMGQDNATMLVREVLAQPVLTTALATQPATSQEGEACICGGGYTICLDGHAINCPASNQRAAYLAMTAATPTPPTLSEDLRSVAALDRAERFAKGLNTTPEEHDDIMVAVEIARAALAQVKAS